MLRFDALALIFQFHKGTIRTPDPCAYMDFAQ